MCASSSAVGLSAQCRSSSSSASGHDRDALASSELAASNRRKRSPSESPPDRRGEIRESPRELGNEPRELAPERAELAPQHLRGHRRSVPAQRLDERLIGDQRLLVTAAEKDRRAILMSGTGEFAHEPRLADARVTRDQREPARPGACFRPLGPKPSERVLATDEVAALAPGQCRW